MTPLQFTIENAIEILPDDLRRTLGSEARKFADAGFPPRRHWREARTIHEMMLYEHRRLFWMDAYMKRKARLKRMADKTPHKEKQR